MNPTPCVIFAGGKSSRMGEDKALLPFGGFDTLTQYQYERMKKIFSKVYISTKNRDKFHFDADFIEDCTNVDVHAPTAGFVAMFDYLEETRVFVLSVDTPFVDERVIDELFKNDSDKLDATIAKSESGMHPMCGIYHRSLEQNFKEMLGNNNHKLGMLLKNSNTKMVNFDDETPFTNLNHPHEYQQALLSEMKLKKEIYELNTLR